MPEIKSMKDLQNALLPVMKDMTDKLADQVYKTLNYFLQSYYDSYDPVIRSDKSQSRFVPTQQTLSEIPVVHLYSHPVTL